MSSAHNVTINLNGFSAADGNYNTLQLASLPAAETFKSHTSNALKANSVTVASNSLTISVPALSTTAILLKSGTTGISKQKNQADEIKIFPNPATNQLNISIQSGFAEPTQITVFDQTGRKITGFVVNFDGYSPINLNLSSLSGGFYLLSVKNNHCASTKSFRVNK
jgi:hypothetical protein